MMKIYFLLVVSILTCGCQSQGHNSDFLDSFYSVSESELKANLMLPKDPAKHLPLEIDKSNANFLELLQIPADEVEYKYEYTPQFKNKYGLLYKYKLSDRYYLVSYYEIFGHMAESSQYLCVYDNDVQVIVSRLTISSPARGKRIQNARYEDKSFFITSTFKTSTDSGLDPVNPQGKVLEEKYYLNERFRFEKAD